MPTLAETWMREGREQGLELGHERGLREGLLAGIEMGLQLRFGAAGLAILPEIADIEDVGTLRAVRDALLTARTLDDVRRVIA